VRIIDWLHRRQGVFFLASLGALIVVSLGGC
jgi:hypothetical protein